LIRRHGQKRRKENTGGPEVSRKEVPDLSTQQKEKRDGGEMSQQKHRGGQTGTAWWPFLLAVRIFVKEEESLNLKWAQGGWKDLSISNSHWAAKKKFGEKEDAHVEGRGGATCA